MFFLLAKLLAKLYVDEYNHFSLTTMYLYKNKIYILCI
jgi:hypothetical protein